MITLGSQTHTVKYDMLFKHNVLFKIQRSDSNTDLYSRIRLYSSWILSGTVSTLVYEIKLRRLISSPIAI